MSTINDVTFTVKGKSVSMPSTKGLPKDVSTEALKRFKILGSAVAGFTGAAGKMPPSVAPMGGAGGPARSRSPSPKPAPKKAVKEKQDPGMMMMNIMVDFENEFGVDMLGDLADGKSDLLWHHQLGAEMIKQMKSEGYSTPETMSALKKLKADGFPFFDHLLDDSEPKPAAKSASKKNVSEVIQNIKVGDKIMYGQDSGYGGDAGDSRDSGYAISRPVLKILPRGRFEVDTQYEGNKPEVFKINKEGDWLVDTNRNRLQVYMIDGKRKLERKMTPEERAADLAEAEARGTKHYQAVLAKEAARREAAKSGELDLAKLTVKELMRIIESYLEKRGKSARGLSTAKKPALVEFIKKNKMLD